MLFEQGPKKIEDYKDSLLPSMELLHFLAWEHAPILHYTNNPKRSVSLHIFSEADLDISFKSNEVFLLVRSNVFQSSFNCKGPIKLLLREEWISIWTILATVCNDRNQKKGVKVDLNSWEHQLVRNCLRVGDGGVEGDLYPPSCERSFI